jgi:hypothetical protein
MGSISANGTVVAKLNGRKNQRALKKKNQFKQVHVL